MWVMGAKALLPASNQKECRSATARLNSCWAAGLHETGKWTVPSFSGAPGFSCASAAEAESRATRITNRSILLGFIKHPLCVRLGCKEMPDCRSLDSIVCRTEDGLRSREVERLGSRVRALTDSPLAFAFGRTPDCFLL